MGFSFSFRNLFASIKHNLGTIIMAIPQTQKQHKMEAYALCDAVMNYYYGKVAARNIRWKKYNAYPRLVQSVFDGLKVYVADLKDAGEDISFFQLEQKSEYMKTKQVYRWVSETVKAQIPQWGGYTQWEMMESAYRVFLVR